MMAIFVDCLSYGLITPMIVAVFSQDIFLAGQPVWLVDVARSLAFALFPLGMFVGAATLGDLSDRWGRKKTLMLCMVGLTLAFTAMAMAVALGSVGLLLLSRLVSGLLGGSMAIGQAAVIDLSTEHTKAVNLGRITIANSMGHFLGPAIGAFLVDQNLYWPFACIAMLALVTFLWITFSLEETQCSHSNAEFCWKRPVTIFLDAFCHKKIRQLSVGYLLFHMGNSMAYQYLYIFLADRKGYSPTELALFSTVAIGLGALFTTFWLLAKLQKRYDALQLSVTPLLVSGVLTVGFVFINTDVFYWVFGFFWAVAVVFAYVSSLKLYSDSASEDMQGWAMGVAGSVFAFAFIIGGLSASLLYWFSVEGMLLASGLILVAAALWFNRLKGAV